MLTTFGWKSGSGGVCQRQCAAVRSFGPVASPTQRPEPQNGALPVPWTLICVYVALLAGIVLAAHHPAVFMALFCCAWASAMPIRSTRTGWFSRRRCWWHSFWRAWSFWWFAIVVVAALVGTDAVVGHVLGCHGIDGCDRQRRHHLPGRTGARLVRWPQVCADGWCGSGRGLTVIANAPNPAGLAILRGISMAVWLVQGACFSRAQPHGCGCGGIVAAVTDYGASTPRLRSVPPTTLVAGATTLRCSRGGGKSQKLALRAQTSEPLHPPAAALLGSAQRVARCVASGGLGDIGAVRHAASAATGIRCDCVSAPSKSSCVTVI